MATHVRVGNPLFTHVLFPTYLAALLWGGLVLRDARLRAFLPWRESELIMNEVKSKDGTTIAYERSGNGPALILVDGALCSRAFGPSPKLAPLLARHFTVFAYDRRGRGQSGDTPPYAPVARSGGHCRAHRGSGRVGVSSSGCRRAERWRSKPRPAVSPITRVVAYEPPYVDDSGQRGGAAYEGQLTRLVAEGNRGGAVKYS